MLAVLDVIERGEVPVNRIELTPELVAAFRCGLNVRTNMGSGLVDAVQIWNPDDPAASQGDAYRYTRRILESWAVAEG